MTHDFLEETALKYGCFISDLKLVPSLRRAAIYDLLHAEPGKYPLDQRREYACYLTGSTRQFETIAEIRKHLPSQFTEWSVKKSVK